MGTFQCLQTRSEPYCFLHIALRGVREKNPPLFPPIFLNNFGPPWPNGVQATAKWCPFHHINWSLFPILLHICWSHPWALSLCVPSCITRSTRLSTSLHIDPSSSSTYHQFPRCSPWELGPQTAHSTSTHPRKDICTYRQESPRHWAIVPGGWVEWTQAGMLISEARVAVALQSEADYRLRVSNCQAQAFQQRKTS